MIADERAGNTQQSTRDDASGRSGEVAGEPGWPSQPVEENAGDDARLREPKKRHNRVGAWIKALRMAQIVRVAAWLPSTIRQWVAAKF